VESIDRARDRSTIPAAESGGNAEGTSIRSLEEARSLLRKQTAIFLHDKGAFQPEGKSTRIIKSRGLEARTESSEDTRPYRSGEFEDHHQFVEPQTMTRVSQSCLGMVLIGAIFFFGRLR